MANFVVNQGLLDIIRDYKEITIDKLYYIYGTANYNRKEFMRDLIEIEKARYIQINGDIIKYLSDKIIIG